MIPARSSAVNPDPLTVTTSLFDVESKADVSPVTVAEAEDHVQVRSTSDYASSEVDKKTRITPVGAGLSLANSSILQVI